MQSKLGVKKKYFTILPYFPKLGDQPKKILLKNIHQKLAFNREELFEPKLYELISRDFSHLHHNIWQPNKMPDDNRPGKQLTFKKASNKMNPDLAKLFELTSHY